MLSAFTKRRNTRKGHAPLWLANMKGTKEAVRSFKDTVTNGKHPIMQEYHLKNPTVSPLPPMLLLIAMIGSQYVLHFVVVWCTFFSKSLNEVE